MSLISDKWNSIESCPEDEEVIFAHFHENTLYWIASGIIEDGEVWSDIHDDFLTITPQAGFHNPSHWLPIECLIAV